MLDYCGIPIKAHEVVSDAALYEVRARLGSMLNHLPTITFNLGMSQRVRSLFDRQYERSIKKGLWVKGRLSASNLPPDPLPDE